MEEADSASDGSSSTLTVASVAEAEGKGGLVVESSALLTECSVNARKLSDEVKKVRKDTKLPTWCQVGVSSCNYLNQKNTAGPHSQRLFLFSKAPKVLH